MSSEPPVEVYAGKFAGTFDLDVSLADQQHFDSPVTFLVTTRISGEAKTGTSDGRIKRSDTFKVHEIVPLDAGLFDRIMNAVLSSTVAEPEQTAEEAGWLPDEETQEVFDPRKLLEDEEVDIGGGMLHDDEADEPLLADEEEIFSPGGSPEIQRVKIAGAYDPLAEEEEDDTAATDELAAFLNGDDTGGVKRDESGRDTALLDFLEV